MTPFDGLRHPCAGRFRFRMVRYGIYVSVCGGMDAAIHCRPWAFASANLPGIANREDAPMTRVLHGIATLRLRILIYKLSRLAASRRKLRCSVQCETPIACRDCRCYVCLHCLPVGDVGVFGVLWKTKKKSETKQRRIERLESPYCRILF